jgi:hypothetical protein
LKPLSAFAYEKEYTLPISHYLLISYNKTFMIPEITKRDERILILFHAKKRRSAKFAKV